MEHIWKVSCPVKGNVFIIAESISDALVTLEAHLTINHLIENFREVEVSYIASRCTEDFDLYIMNGHEDA